MTVKITLRNGLYYVYNGDEVNGVDCAGLLVIHEKDAYFSGFTTNPFFETLKKVDVPTDKGLFEHLRITDYKAVSSFD